MLGVGWGLQGRGILLWSSITQDPSEQTSRSRSASSTYLPCSAARSVGSEHPRINEDSV